MSKKDDFCHSFIRQMKDMANPKGFCKPRDVYQEAIWTRRALKKYIRL